MSSCWQCHASNLAGNIHPITVRAYYSHPNMPGKFCHCCLVNSNATHQLYLTISIPLLSKPLMAIPMYCSKVANTAHSMAMSCIKLIWQHPSHYCQSLLLPSQHLARQICYCCLVDGNTMYQTYLATSIPLLSKLVIAIRTCCQANLPLLSSQWQCHALPQHCISSKHIQAYTFEISLIVHYRSGDTFSSYLVIFIILQRMKAALLQSLVISWVTCGLCVM